ncbi:unnamed protein product [Macrosiphum euphorbiae]|nr:unnamed protein product [Macrosiphum euphorbiae]
MTPPVVTEVKIETPLQIRPAKADVQQSSRDPADPAQRSRSSPMSGAVYFGRRIECRREFRSRRPSFKPTDYLTAASANVAAAVHASLLQEPVIRRFDGMTDPVTTTIEPYSATRCGNGLSDSSDVYFVALDISASPKKKDPAQSGTTESDCSRSKV